MIAPHDNGRAAAPSRIRADVLAALGTRTRWRQRLGVAADVAVLVSVPLLAWLAIRGAR